MTMMQDSLRIARTFAVARQSQGFPTKTHGRGASSIAWRPSQGLAGAYRDPDRSTISSRVVLSTVSFSQGTSFRAATCRTPCIPPRSTAQAPRAEMTPPLDALNRVTGSVAQRRVALAVIAGRLKPSAGRVVVLDRMVPDEAAWVRSRVAVDTSVPARDVRTPLVLLDLANGGISRSADEVRRLSESGAAVLVACPAETLDADPTALERLGRPPVVRLTDADREEVLA